MNVLAFGNIPHITETTNMYLCTICIYAQYVISLQNEIGNRIQNGK